jgi:hypothetical protein
LLACLSSCRSVSPIHFRIVERLLRACAWFLSPFFENWSADELYIYLHPVYLSLGLLPRGTTLQHLTDCKVQPFE